MADEPRDEAPEVQDQPEPSAPETGTSATEVEDQGDSPFNLNDVPEDVRPHVEQYAKQLQGDYTRKTQDLAEDRRLLDALTSEDPRMQTLALEALGFDLDSEDEDLEPEFDEDPDFEVGPDPNDELRTEVEALKAHQAEEQYMGWLSDQLDQVEQAEGRELSDAEQEHLVALAEHYEDQMGPNFEKAYEAFRALSTQAQTNLINSKKTPRGPSQGRQALQKVDYRNEEDRVNAFAALMDAHADDE